MGNKHDLVVQSFGNHAEKRFGGNPLLGKMYWMQLLGSADSRIGLGCQDSLSLSLSLSSYVYMYDICMNVHICTYTLIDMYPYMYIHIYIYSVAKVTQLDVL